MKILYKLASRSRPAALLRCLDNMRAMMHHNNYAIEVTADLDDETMVNECIKNEIESFPNTRIHYGTTANKISAINRDMEFFNDWDILINMSDDMEFIMHGFDLQIIKDYQTTTGDILMHYPDQKAQWAMITMAIMDRRYYDRDGYIYNPEYKSLFCDNEQMEVATLRKRYKLFKSRLFNHNNPMHGLSPKDDLFLRNNALHNEDKATFERRKLIKFGL